MIALVDRLRLWFEHRPLLRFVLAVFALLPACFLAWYALGVVIAGPSVMLADFVLGLWLPDVIESTRLEGTQLVVLSHYGETGGRFGPAEAMGNQLGYPINTRTLSYSIPFFSALYFATPQRGGMGSYAWALLGLWLLLAAGLVATAAKDLMLGLGTLFLDQPYVPPTDAIALAYQFSVLMVPPLAPVLLWAYVAAESPAFRALFSAVRRPLQARD